MWSWKTTNTKISPPGVSRLAKLPIALMMSESDPRFHSRFLNAVQFHFSTCNFHQMMMKTTFKRGCMYLQGDKDWFRSSVESFLSNGKYLAICEHQHKESYSCIMSIFMTLFASWHMTFLPRLSGRHQIGKRSCWKYSHIFVQFPVLSELLCCNISLCEYFQQQVDINQSHHTISTVRHIDHDWAYVWQIEAESLFVGGRQPVLSLKVPIVDPSLLRGPSWTIVICWYYFHFHFRFHFPKSPHCWPLFIMGAELNHSHQRGRSPQICTVYQGVTF